MTFIYYAAVIVFMLIAVLLCMVILAQESKSSGLGASFGGDAGNAMFGTATADVLKKFTAWLAVLFFAACILLSFWSSAIGRTQTRSQTVIERSAP